jgi:sialate O-acetylesterase
MKYSRPIKARHPIFIEMMDFLRTVLLFASLLVFAAAPQAEASGDHPFLHPMFCDHAAHQHDVQLSVWGWSEPGSKIFVTFAGQSWTAIADKDGDWAVKLQSMPASSEFRTLSVANPTTDKSALLNDVPVGDVRL